MAVPFCTACGAAVAEGTRFCVKCGQRVGQEAPLPAEPPSPVPTVEAAIPPAPPPVVVTPPPPIREGAGPGVWIGIFGILLLVGGAGLWFYSTRVHRGPPMQVASAPLEPTQAPTPLSTPEPTPPPTPTPAPTPEAIPRKPAPKPAPPPRPVEAPRPGASAPPPAAVALAPPTTGVLHAAVEVAQNGEVVFENLPAARLRFTFDHSAWQPTISRQPNGTQTLVMRSLKPGIQTNCDVRWEIIQ